MLTSNEILSYLIANKSYLHENFHCTKIGLFGSYARNQQTETSDIDIIVLFEPDTPDLYYTELALKELIAKNFNKKVDICSEKWINPIFKPTILKEAMYA
ncbi:MAG: nucleotidyltransferase family protein [Bacteroidales bacterium]